MRSDAIDILNQVFGKLIAIGKNTDDNKWICVCECGNIRHVRSYDLRHGKALMCLDCLNKSKQDLKRNKLEGTQIGNWEVLKYIGNKQYLCRCKCGEEHKVFALNLTGGKSKSCEKCSQLAKLIDLTGKTYGSLNVKEYNSETHKWVCICICGNVVEISAGSLTSGNSTQCQKCATKARLTDITGKHYGEWEVLEYVGNLKWKCKCSCGKIASLHGHNIRSGHTTSCGHNSLLSLAGEVINEWTVLKYMGKCMWLCKCSCGTEKLVHGYELRSNSAKSCGCKKWEYARMSLLTSYGEVAPIKINRTDRAEWQIKAVESKENLAKIIEGFINKPTSIELADKLGLQVHSTLRYIHKYTLEDKVDISPSISKQEKEIIEFIKTLNISDIIQSDRKILSGKEIDIYIPSLKIAIEFNGTYWHSSIFKDKKYHQEKTIACAKQGIQLIHIFEYEWDDSVQQDKIKRLLINIMSKNSRVLYGRSVKVNDISSKEASEFCSEYHLQSSVNASVRHGLFNGNELVGIMTFSKPRFNNNYEWELIRLAWKSGIHVVGGIEKLFNTFVKEYNPESIVSYCDISKFTGDSYAKLGFTSTEKDITEPNYVWVNVQENEILSRYQTQKHKLVENGLDVYGETEDEIMTNLEYYKIYDSGNLKFSWYKSK